jgi:hypothetical protein
MSVLLMQGRLMNDVCIFRLSKRASCFVEVGNVDAWLIRLGGNR